MTEHAEHKKTKLKISKLQLFQVLAVILAVALVASFALNSTGCSITGDAVAVGKQTIGFINTNLLPTDIQATLVNSTCENGNYKIYIDIMGQTNPIYVSSDKKMLFPSGIDMTQKLPQASQGTTDTSEPFDAPDAEKPTVKLFVMSFCPYGQQAENIMLPVVKLLGDKVTIEPHFIVNVEGTTVDSLHGEYEANENMRQACIWKYEQSKFWTYIEKFNGACYENNIDTCWKEKAQEVGIDVAKIEDCFETEGIALMEADQELTTMYQVMGSPTLLINEAEYYGARTPDGYKEGICSGFITQPAECEQMLSEDGTAANGSC